MSVPFSSEETPQQIAERLQAENIRLANKMTEARDRLYQLTKQISPSVDVTVWFPQAAGERLAAK